MITVTLTPEEIRQKGWEALEKELGFVNTIRFIQLIHPGKGDYTAERHQWLDDLDVGEIVQSIMDRRAEKTG